MVSPRRIRDRLALIADSKGRAAARVEEVEAVVTDIVAATSVTRGTVRYEFQRPVLPILDRAGNVIGVDVLVRVFRGANELHVDGHRRFIPPPLLAPDGTTRQEVSFIGDTVTRDNMKEDPREALLQALEQSIASTPNAAGWTA